MSVAARLPALGKAKVAPVLIVGTRRSRWRRSRFRAVKLGDRAQNPATMTERSDTGVQALICRIVENREIDIVGKVLGVLGNSEFFRANQ